MAVPEIVWRMPDGFREEFKRTLGPVVKDEGLLRTIGGRPVTAVGDVTASSVLKAGLKPMLIIVDFGTRRGPLPMGDRDMERVQTYGDRVVNVKNPAAVLTRDLWTAIKDAYARAAMDGTSTRIEVDGEEDLASLPCLIMAPEGSVVTYGVPSKGMTVVTTGKDIKELVVRVLKGCTALDEEGP